MDEHPFVRFFGAQRNTPSPRLRDHLTKDKEVIDPLEMRNLIQVIRILKAFVTYRVGLQPELLPQLVAKIIPFTHGTRSFPFESDVLRVPRIPEDIS
jgi:hypothetical protein